MSRNREPLSTREALEKMAKELEEIREILRDICTLMGTYVYRRRDP